MRKNIARIILVSLPLLSISCSNGEVGRSATMPPTPVAHTQPTEAVSPDITFSAKPAAPVVPKPAEQERFIPGATADEGVVVESRQVVRERLVLSQQTRPKQYSFNQAAAPNLSKRNVSEQDRPSSPPAWQATTEASKTKFRMAIQEPLSTFSADVDSASYSNIRREIQNGQQPRPETVRVEEMLNYFNYDLPEPKAGEPFSVTTELSTCPWSPDSELLRVAVKTKSLDRGDSPPRNLVFLLDVSGSMQNADKLPLLKTSLRQFVDTLDDSDRVAIVVYAGSSGIVLPSTTGDKKTEILAAIEQLRAGGSTNGESGIQLAYSLAEENKADNSVNRVILATDGDFNVGVSSTEELKSLIESKRESGLFLSVLGFGRHGNDKLMETLADNGNGNYASIDTLQEARKVLIKEAGATLVTVAKDVKFQVAFHPAEVKSYRLIGYKNRRLANQDFQDDTKDAGELGAGHEVTALYEIRRKDGGIDRTLLSRAGLISPSPIATLKMRYKAPNADVSQLLEREVRETSRPVKDGSKDQQWAAAVAEFGLTLEGEIPPSKQTFPDLYSLLKPTMAGDPDAYQSEFYSLVKKSEELMGLDS
jgi:Ca-activated chloride channel homolog